MVCLSLSHSLTGGLAHVPAGRQEMMGKGMRNRGNACPRWRQGFLLEERLREAAGTTREVAPPGMEPGSAAGRENWLEGAGTKPWEESHSRDQAVFP